jgi:hypothetical protein
MKIAVLLLSCAGSNRRTNLTKSWFEAALGRVRAYFLTQSGQRVTFDFTVFDWTELSITSDEWIALGASVGATAKAEIAQAKDVDLSGFDWFILIIDDQISTSGATDQDTRIAAISATPAIITHELGHLLGAMHTYLKKPEGIVEYGGPFCTMGGEGDKHTFSDPQVSAVLAGELGTHAASGPGMCIPNLLNAGWLDAAQHIRKIVVSSDGSISSSERLIALDGAPPAGANVVCGLEIELGDRFICEYRSPRVFWDQGVENPDGTR